MYPPSLTTRDREQVSDREVRIEPWDLLRSLSLNHLHDRLGEPETTDSAVRHSTTSTTGWGNPRALTPQSVTQPPLPRARRTWDHWLRGPSLKHLYHGLGEPETTDSAVRHSTTSTIGLGNPRPPTPQSVTQPPLPRAGRTWDYWLRSPSVDHLYHGGRTTGLQMMSLLFKLFK